MTRLKRDSIQNVANVEYHVLSLVLFLRCVWYGLTNRLAYHRMVSGYECDVALLCLPLDYIKLRYSLEICRLL